MSARQLLAGGLLVAAAAFALRTDPVEGPPPVAETAAPSAMPEDRADATLAFEANQGQTDEHVRFVSRGDGYTLFLAPDEAVMRLRDKQPADPDGRTRAAATSTSVVRLSLVGADPDPVVSGEDPLVRTTHYFIGNDPAQWQRDVPSYGKVRYQAVYPGIDAVYYGTQGQLEYDFIVAPGADPGAIALEFGGVDGLRLDDAGNLLLAVRNGEVVQHKPVVYQDVGGVRRFVEGAYTLLGAARVGFSLGSFDASLPLVIDPVLAYSTYLGGDNTEQAESLAVDRAGNTWVAGSTDSLVFPWANALDSEYGGGEADAYLCRFSAAGGIPLCAYIGGEGSDEGWAVAVGNDGSVYAAGYTESWDFPIVNAAQAYPGSTTAGDAFLLKVNATTDGLDFSTRLGGNDFDNIRALAVDAAGSVYATGNTWSWEGFPVTAGAFMATNPAGQDAFVAKYTKTGTMAFSTMLGGGLEDAGRGIAVAPNGRVYVSGHTTSEDFPVKAPLQARHAGAGDAFIAVLNATGTRLLYGTYLGGSGEDWGYDLRLDTASRMHLSGFTWSADFPLASPLQGVHGGDRDGFVVRLSATGSAMEFGTYIGGDASDDIRHLALDRAGNMVMAGYTTSTDFPMQGALQARGGQDAVVLKISADGRSLLSSTALGGTDFEVLAGMEIDLDGTIHVAGWTASTDFPVAAAVQGVHANPSTETAVGMDTFLTRIADQALDAWKADFNGDGKSDILWRNNSTGQSAIWHSASSQTAVNLTRIANLAWRAVGVGDFDGDGSSDVLWRNAETGANVIWRSGRSATSQAVTSVTNVDWQVQGTGDFDGNGTADIVWHNTATGQTALWLDAQYAKRRNLTQVTNLDWDIIGTGDFDGDGRADLAWRNASTGQNTVWRTGNSQTKMANSRLTGQQWQLVGIGDFQGDGKDDFVWRNVVTGANSIWKGGSPSTLQAVARVASRQWQIHGVGDYNGDGVDDLLWRDSARGNNSIWRSGNASTTQAVTRVAGRMEWVVKS